MRDSTEDFNSAETAISFLTESVKQKNYPKLIVLDVNMPKVNGFQLLHEFKEILPVFVPVLFLSTSQRDADILYSEKHMASFMLKPTDVKGYQVIIDTLFKSLL